MFPVNIGQLVKPLVCWGFTQVTPEIIALTLWYSVAAVGIAIVNDFKSVEGGVGGLREEKDPPKMALPK